MKEYGVLQRSNIRDYLSRFILKFSEVDGNI